MREIGFQQVLVVPVLTSLGLGVLLYAQNISFTGSIGLAAPIVEPALPSRRTSKIDRLAVVDSMGLELPLPGVLGQTSEDDETIKATSQKELLIRARENSGREDPFVPLIQPDSSVVVPPALVALPALDPFMPSNIDRDSGKKTEVKLKKRTIKVKVRDVRTGKLIEVSREILEPAPALDLNSNPPLSEEPGWLVSGIFSTGHDTLAIVELGGVSREVRVGDILDDNSRILDITPQTLTFYKNGKKFVKTIGEIK